MRRRVSVAAVLQLAMVALMMMVVVTESQRQLEAAGDDHPGPLIVDKEAAIRVQDIPKEFTKMGLIVKDARAKRAFYAKDYAKVSYDDFRALWAVAEQAKRDEDKLIRAHSSDHAIICNKLRKLGLEAIMGTIYMTNPFDNGKPDHQYASFVQEHLLKFRKNMLLAGKTCKDVRL